MVSLPVKYKVAWDNGDGHACGEFETLYDAEELAKAAGESWVEDMHTVDPSGDGQYTFDVVEVIQYPDCYMHVRDCKSGENWIVPIRARQTLDLKRRLKEWIKSEFCDELKLDGDITPRLDGDFYARIMTDGREPDSVICWTGGGFYLKSAYPQ